MTSSQPLTSRIAGRHRLPRVARTTSAVAALLIAGWTAACPAASVVLKDGATVRGKLVSESEFEIVLNVPTGDGGFRERVFDRQQIDIFLNPVDKDRLATLRSDKPQAYQTFAEELAEKKADPDARELGIRLYLIAAYLNPAERGRSCLLGMTNLARNSEEERRFRAMVYLLDPAHERRWLAGAKVAAAVGDGGADEGSADLALQGIVALRRGELQEARNFSRRDEFLAQLDKVAVFVTRDEFVEHAVVRCPQCTRGLEQCPQCGGVGRHRGRVCSICSGRKKTECSRCRGNFKEPPVPRTMMRKLILAEMAIRGERVATPSAKSRPKQNWSQILRGGRTGPVPILKLESLTEFDPRLCHFQDGKWVAP
ncbi:MAG: hypothetical protein QGG36_05565 [Pirellulaceae bacterium]|nr:hypothetical protein [Pirellulaceae bacterium]MDP7015243.1 hypothetical protein [Pirellulaceae bacterium]